MDEDPESDFQQKPAFIDRVVNIWRKKEKEDDTDPDKTSTRAPIANNSIVVYKEEEKSDYDEYSGFDASRNLSVTSENLYRKGPIPIESLSRTERVRLSRLGCLK